MVITDIIKLKASLRKCSLPVVLIVGGKQYLMNINELDSNSVMVMTCCDSNEPQHEKTNVLHMQKQRRRSASQ